MSLTDNSLLKAMKARWHQLPLWGKAVVATVGVVILLSITKPEPEVTPKKEKVWLIDTQFAQPGSNSPQIKLLGRLESPADSNISASINASVDAILVQEGEYVDAGEVLFTLNNDEVRLAYQQRQAEHAEILARIETEKLQHEANIEALEIEKELLKLSEKSVNRFKQLAKNQLSAERQLDEATQALARQRLSVNQKELAIRDHDNRLSQLEALELKARALKERAKIDFEQSEVVAPFSGRVSKIYVAPGENVGRGTSLVQMFDTSSMQIRAQIPNRYLAQVKDALNPPRKPRAMHEPPEAFPSFLSSAIGENLAEETEDACAYITNYDREQPSVISDILSSNEEPAASVPAEPQWIFRPGQEREAHALYAEGLKPDGNIPLRLARLAGSVGSGRGGVDGLFEVLDDQSDLELGIPVEILVNLPKEPWATIVPPHALHGIDRVYRVHNSRLEGIRVERLGDIYSQSGQVTGVLVRSYEIMPGDRIMTTNLPHALPGLKVTQMRTNCY